MTVFGICAANARLLFVAVVTGVFLSRWNSVVGACLRSAVLQDILLTSVPTFSRKCRSSVQRHTVPARCTDCRLSSTITIVSKRHDYSVSTVISTREFDRWSLLSATGLKWVHLCVSMCVQYSRIRRKFSLLTYFVIVLILCSCVLSMLDGNYWYIYK